ncbi:MAG: HepT-like ribonuclease domain-containing protein [Candidatus Hecatellaceae archaeon]
MLKKLSDHAKLRNVIVHRYIEIDYGLLYEKALELVNMVSQLLGFKLKSL